MFDRAAIQHDHELGDLGRRVVDHAHDASERAGLALGRLAAPVFALTSSLRRARTFHPRGDCADAEVIVADGVPPELSRLAAHLTGTAFVRFSDALTKYEARWPDVLGCAIRFGRGDADPARHGDQDLLFATIKRPWTMPLSPLSTHVGDYFDNDYFAVSPFSIGQSNTRVYFRLRPANREYDEAKGGSIEGPPSTVRLAEHHRWRRPGRTRAELRRWHLERAIATGGGRLILGIGSRPWGPFAPLVEIALVSIRLVDPPNLKFDPFRDGRGIVPRGFVHSLRRGVYASSQRARHATTELDEVALSSRAT